MPYDPVPVRFARAVGWVGSCSVWWGARDSCAPGLEHVAGHELRSGDGEAPDENAYDGWLEWHPDPGTPCERCGAPFDPDVDHNHSGGTKLIWSTESGKLEPGCLYWVDCQQFRCAMRGPEHGCEGRHVWAVLPDGHAWDIDARASNCTRPDEPHHCWVRHNDPETETAIFTVDKDGDTCAAGAGSIDDGTYHGFLTNGAFTAG